MFIINFSVYLQDVSDKEYEEAEGAEEESDGDYTTEDEAEHSEAKTGDEESEEESEVENRKTSKLEEGECSDSYEDEEGANQGSEDEQLWKNERRHSGDGAVTWNTFYERVL